MNFIYGLPNLSKINIVLFLKKSSDLRVMLNHQLKTVGNSRVVSKSDYFSGEYSQYLFFHSFVQQIS